MLCIGITPAPTQMPFALAKITGFTKITEITKITKITTYHPLPLLVQKTQFRHS